MQVENLKKALESKEANAQFSKMKEPRSPREKPKAIPQQTPPCVRRLNIENGSNMKSDKTMNPEETGVRRLSIENGSNMKSDKTMNPEETRVRRLSIENGSNMKSDKRMNPEERKGTKTPSVPTRSRRLSLEGQRYCKKDSFQTKVGEDVSKPVYFDTMTLQKYGQFQDAEAVSKPYGHSSKGGSVMEVYRLNAPRSPTSSSYQKRMVKKDNRTQIPHLQLPTSPEPHLARNEVQVVMQSELTLSTDSQTANLISSANGKGSQIRKSLRTIGKLINGSEKRYVFIFYLCEACIICMLP